MNRTRHSKEIIQLKNWLHNGSQDMGVIGLSGSARAYFLAEILADLNRPCLIILPDTKAAYTFYQTMQFFMPDQADEAIDGRLHPFFPYDISPLSGLSPHQDLVARRIGALYELLTQKRSVVVSSVEALCFKIPPKAALVGALGYFETGEEIDRKQLLDTLDMTGYQRTSLVEERGDYAVRGGVIDLFSPLYPRPVRMEFWGDHLESIRQFDSESQRSQGYLDAFILLPANEILLTPENIQHARSMGRLPRQAQPDVITNFPGQEAWLNHFYDHLDTLTDYLPENGLITAFDPHRWEKQIKKLQQKFDKDQEKFQREAAEKGHPFPNVNGLFVPMKEISTALSQRTHIFFSDLKVGLRNTPENTITVEGRFPLDPDVSVTLAHRGKVSMAPLAEKVAAWREGRSRVIITCGSRQQADRLQEILGNYEVPVDGIVDHWGHIPPGPGLYLCLGRLSKGFAWPEQGLYVLSENEIFGPKRGGKRPQRSKTRDALTWSSFSLLKAGDFVVHEEHGIGRYGGLATMEVAQRVHDFVIIEYADHSRLYLPADRVSVLQKYAGAEQKNPKLDQLGGQAWKIAKQKAGKSVQKIAKQLVELYALRNYRQGHAFSPPDYHYRQFEAGFEHEETDDQLKAVEDVLTDLASEQPMDRLICGDVGFGKTEIALRAMFKVVSDGKQAAFLVPTTVLAEQHFETITRRMAAYGIEVGLLSRFKTRNKQKEVIASLRSGRISILVGTHRILQKDVSFAELGLLIVDEEQRFGVKQKEALKRYRALVDVLAITATPVPRTLQMSMTGVRDLSVIETPPEDRLSIETYLSNYDESLICRAVDAEVSRGGQTFFVHNRVQTIDAIADRLKRLAPHVRFAVAHGQMKTRDLEQTMLRFLKKDIDVLICSTIIESGLDIPSANTIIINEADRMGLAQIYQLRGRVGRAKEKAYAYLLVSKDSTLTRDAEKRLKALMEFSHLGAGLHLAMHDLKIRGGGNILGFAQSGHITAIGYELYLKFIERAVCELKGEEWEDAINPEINVQIPAYLPGDYVMDTDLRLNLYRRLSSVVEETELKETMEEISDRFGPPPREVENLFALMEIRLQLKQLNIQRLDAGDRSITLTFAHDGPGKADTVLKHIQQMPKRFQYLSQNRLKVHLGKLSLPGDLSKIMNAVNMLNFQDKPEE